MRITPPSPSYQLRLPRRRAVLRPSRRSELRVAIPWTPENLGPDHEPVVFPGRIGDVSLVRLRSWGCDAREPQSCPGLAESLAPVRRGRVAAPEASPGRRLPRWRGSPSNVPRPCASPSSRCSIRSEIAQPSPANVAAEIVRVRWWTKLHESTSSRASPMRCVPSSTARISPVRAAQVRRREQIMAPARQWARVPTIRN